MYRILNNIRNIINTLQENLNIWGIWCEFWKWRNNERRLIRIFGMETLKITHFSISKQCLSRKVILYILVWISEKHKCVDKFRKIVFVIHSKKYKSDSWKCVDVKRKLNRWQCFFWNINHKHCKTLKD